MDIFQIINEFLNIANNALDFVFLWGGLVLNLGYPFYFFFKGFVGFLRVRRKNPYAEHGTDIFTQSLALLLICAVMGGVWALPEALAYIWPPLEFLPGTWFRWALLMFIMLGLAYRFGQAHGGRRWLQSSLGHMAAIVFGLVAGRWIGLLLITIPALVTYYSMLYNIAVVTLPASNPDDPQEKWKRFIILAAYSWGIQSPILVADRGGGKQPEVRISGDFTWAYPVPGMVWTPSNEIVAITEGINFKRMDGPGVAFTGKFEIPIQVFDLRVQLQTREIDVVSKDGINLEVRASSAVRIDPAIGKKVLSVLGTKNVPADVFPNWERWAFRAIENHIRNTISQKNIVEFWQSNVVSIEGNALAQIAHEITDNASATLTDVGIRLLTVRIDGLRFPSSMVRDYWRAVQKLRSQPDGDESETQKGTAPARPVESKRRLLNTQEVRRFYRSQDTRNQVRTSLHPKDLPSPLRLYSSDQAYQDSARRRNAFVLPVVTSFVIALIYALISRYQLLVLFFGGYLSGPKLWAAVIFVVVLFGVFAIILYVPAMRSAVDFFNQLYRPPREINSKKIITQRLFGKSRLPQPLNNLFSFPYVLIRETEIADQETWATWMVQNIGGPARLLVFDGAAVYLERGNRFSRVVSPSEITEGKFPFLEWYETVKYIVDVRPSAKTDTFDVWTKDGIKIRLTVQMACQIGNPTNSDTSRNLFYPVDPVAVRKAVDHYGVQWPAHENSTPTEFIWLDAAWEKVIGVIASNISIKTLDDLLPESQTNRPIFSPTALNDMLLAVNRGTNNFGVYVTYVGVLRSEVFSTIFVVMESVGNEIMACKTLHTVATFGEKTKWIPDELRSENKTLLLGVEWISAHVRAALESDTLYNKQEQLRQALEVTLNIKQSLKLVNNTNIVKQWNDALEVWKRLFEEHLKEVNGIEVIPNVFISGSPLAAASKVFKGRSDLFRTLERELTSAAEQMPALLLFGARRTGKTSVIRQLPGRLGPHIVPVEVDLQSASTAEGATGLLLTISHCIQKACAFHHLNIPLLPSTEKDLYHVFQSWLSDVESALGTHRLLIALDEYEALGDMFKDRRVDERIFRLLRSLIQQHPKFIMMFSGAHTLEDLPPIWSHYLVNVRMLKVGALKQSEARELITSPIPEFNLKYQVESVERILSATACQPYLIQLTCRELVNCLNEANLVYATRDDVENALSIALVSGGAYFHDLFNGRDSDDAQRVIMSELAQLEPMTLVQLRNKTNLTDEALRKSLRQLMHRDVLSHMDNTYQFQVELVRRWIREHTYL